MVTFSIIFSVIFLCAKFGSTISINNHNNIFIYDKDNNNFYSGNNGVKKWVKLKDVSPYLIKATIYSEDKRFYEHYGFDIPRIIKSIFINIKSNDLSQGASTITQQYARNLFLTFDKTWERKIKEAWYAFKLETQYSKDKILEGYLNSINYGNGVLGIENAAHYYFNKSAKDLNLAESTMLAGIPKSPNNYSPLNNLKMAKKRQKNILKVLLYNKVINYNDYKNALDKKLSYYGIKDSLNLKTLLYYQDAVMKELESLQIISEEKIREEGIKIYTNLDIKAQKALEDSIDKNLKDKKEMQTAAIMMNPKNGNIIALAGGKDYSKSQFNRATDAKRQVGSTMKPILYYAALDNGLTASTTFVSKPTTFNLDNKKTYSPKNFSNKYPNDKITMALAIAYSDNIYAIKTHLFLGEDMLVKYANKMGITEKLNPNASLPLGTSEISLNEFISAYSELANTGYKVRGHLISKIVNKDGKTIYNYKQDKIRVLKKEYTYILSDMLSNTYDSSLRSYVSPTCLSIAPRLTKKYAVKSGTTDYDLWTIGYNPDVVLGVWTGYDDNRKLKKEYKYSKNIWANAVETYLRDNENKWFKKPENVNAVLTDLQSGTIATNQSKYKKILYYVNGSEPQKK